MFRVLSRRLYNPLKFTRSTSRLLSNLNLTKSWQQRMKLYRGPAIDLFFCVVLIKFPPSGPFFDNPYIVTNIVPKGGRWINEEGASLVGLMKNCLGASLIITTPRILSAFN